MSVAVRSPGSGPRAASPQEPQLLQSGGQHVVEDQGDASAAAGTTDAAPGSGAATAAAAAAASGAAAAAQTAGDADQQVAGQARGAGAAGEGRDLDWEATKGRSPARGRSRSPERRRSRSASRSRSAGSEGRRHKPHRHSRSRSRSRSREERRRRSRGGSTSRERRSRSKSRSRSDSERRRHKRHHSHKHKEHRHHHHTHKEHHKRSRSRSRSKGRSRSRSRSRSAPKEGHHHHSHHHHRRHPSVSDAAGALQRDGSGGATSLGKLSLRQHAHPSPATVAAVAALLPPGAAAALQAGRSPALGPQGLLRVATPSAAALAAAQGADPSEVALVQPSPMAAEATVAALSALMAQPARPAPPPPAAAAAAAAAAGPKRPGGASAAPAAAVGDKGRQLLSFGDELEELGGGEGGLGPATSKRFKHEKTLVVLNPHLADQTPFASAYEDDEELPCSPAAPLDKRLGQVLWGSAQAKGMRPYMEDRHTVIHAYQPRTSTGQFVEDGVPRAYAAVFDGHNGAGAAEHAADRLHHVLAAEAALRTCTGEGPPATALREEERVAAALVHSFEAVDREIMTQCRLTGTKGGATGLVLLRMGNQLYAAHCGDTRAVLSRSGEALRLTEDHKPNLPRERKRVEGLGGRVDFARCWRVIVDPGDGRPASGLAVSRSFGDPDFKEPLHLVTATPDVIRERLLPGDEFMILASDGLWDVLSDSEACAIVRRHLQQSGAPRQITPPQLLHGAAAFGGAAFAEQMRRPPVLTAALATAAAERLVQVALDKGTMDNCTAVVGLLQWD